MIDVVENRLIAYGVLLSGCSRMVIVYRMTCVIYRDMSLGANE